MSLGFLVTSDDENSLASDELPDLKVDTDDDEDEVLPTVASFLTKVKTEK